MEEYLEMPGFDSNMTYDRLAGIVELLYRLRAEQVSRETGVEFNAKVTCKRKERGATA